MNRMKNKKNKWGKNNGFLLSFFSGETKPKWNLQNERKGKKKEKKKSRRKKELHKCAVLVGQSFGWCKMLNRHSAVCLYFSVGSATRFFSVDLWPAELMFRFKLSASAKRNCSWNEFARSVLHFPSISPVDLIPSSCAKLILLTESITQRVKYAKRTYFFCSYWPGACRLRLAWFDVCL